MEQLKTFKRFKATTAINIFLLALLFITVLIPVFFIFAELGTIDVGKLLISKIFLKACLNSILVSITATAISMVFAFLLAFALSRSNIRFKGIFTVMITIPMLIPSISHGMGLIVLFGSNGLITNLFGFKGDIYGFWGIVIGSVMYSFPMAFLMFNDILRYEDKSVYAVADIMGIPKHRQFLNITLPYMKKSLISIFFATFTLVFTDYGVAMMIGGRVTTLPLFMYNEVIGQSNFGVGAIVAIVLFIPAIVAFIFDIFNKDAGNITYSTNNISNKDNKKRDIVAYILCVLSVIIIILPIIIFSVIGFFNKYPSDMTLSFNNALLAFEMKAGQFFLNSLMIALFVGIIGTAVSYCTAYITARTNSKMRKYLHLISLVSLAIPGVVLGISYSLMYRGSFLSGTLAMLILVNIAHFFSSPYLMCYNALNKVNKNYEVVAKTMQINKFRFVKDILFPETFDTIIEMFSYFFVNSMVTISAVAFLSTSANMPLSLLINQFEAQALIECISIVSLMILIVNGILKLTIYIIKRQRGRKNAK